MNIKNNKLEKDGITYDISSNNSEFIKNIIQSKYIQNKKFESKLYILENQLNFIDSQVKENKIILLDYILKKEEIIKNIKNETRYNLKSIYDNCNLNEIYEKFLSDFKNFDNLISHIKWFIASFKTEELVNSLNLDDWIIFNDKLLEYNNYKISINDKELEFKNINYLFSYNNLLIVIFKDSYLKILNLNNFELIHDEFLTFKEILDLKLFQNFLIFITNKNYIIYDIENKTFIFKQKMSIYQEKISDNGFLIITKDNKIYNILNKKYIDINIDNIGNLYNINNILIVEDNINKKLFLYDLWSFQVKQTLDFQTYFLKNNFLVTFYNFSLNFFKIESNKFQDIGNLRLNNINEIQEIKYFNNKFYIKNNKNIYKLN